VLGLAALVVVFGVAAPLGAGWWIAKPYRVVEGPPPADLEAEDVVIPSASGSALRGWLVPATSTADDARGVVLVLHGVHSCRLRMVERARLLKRAGFASLLLDLQAEGESPGERITYGALEARDAEAGLAFLRSRFPNRPIGAIGVSLGGAALCLAKQPLPLKALVLESVYSTIELATRHRTTRMLGPLGSLTAPLLTVQLKWRFGLSADEMRPVDRIGAVGCPVLVAQGTKDPLTTLDEGRALFDAAREPREFWPVEGAAHVDLLWFAKDDYERRVVGFLERNLR
jgi:fermentation-respiration switch protein FrsA (DUF1100 family)